MESSALHPAPEITAEELVGWMYHPQSQIKVSGPDHQILALPEREQLAQLVQLARSEGYRWALLDGPRATRSDWLLDLWWEEQPEMPASLLARTQARCLKLADLLAMLDA